MVREHDPDPLTAGADSCSYADFGETFFDTVVTAERVAEAVGSVTGTPIEIGPLAVGPARLARVRVTGSLGIPSAVRTDGEPLRFRLTLPAALTLQVDLGGQVNRFHGRVAVSLDLTARSARPLVIVIDVDPPGPDDVEVDLAPDGLRASLLRSITDIDEEIRKQVVRYIGTQLDAPEVLAVRRIDVLAQIDAAFAARHRAPAAGTPTHSPGTPD